MSFFYSIVIRNYTRERLGGHQEVYRPASGGWPNYGGSKPRTHVAGCEVFLSADEQVPVR